MEETKESKRKGKKKKQQWKLKQIIQKNKKNRQHKRYTYVYKQSSSHPLPPVPQLESIASDIHISTNHPPPPLKLSSNTNLLLIMIDDIDVTYYSEKNFTSLIHQNYKNLNMIYTNI